VSKVVLFDIDGTLVLTGGAGMRAMTRAFEELYAVQDAFNGIPMPGRTDAGILAQAAAVHGIAPLTLDAFHDVYLGHLRRELYEPGPRKGVMPGIRPLLDALAGDTRGYLALLTGNFEQAAQAKLEYFDLWRYFPCGAFGDAVHERNPLLAAALSRVHQLCGRRADPADVIVIGDTPLDVQCAAAGGARSIAVATGGSGVDALTHAGADVVFRDLTDTKAVLAAIFRE
jgi:phosphoglycolate phosphatase-like HAD superfamily hydrolase